MKTVQYRLEVDRKIQKPWSGRKPFCSPGGNTGMSRIIVDLLPSHRFFVEPFCGGAAVFFRKEPSSKELINDLNPDIAFAYRFIRDHTPSQRKALHAKDWTLTQSRFRILTRMRPDNPIDRFYRFTYLTLGSYNYERIVFNSEYKGEKMSVVEHLSHWQERLRGVEVLNQDYSDVLERYDSRDTLFYIDPPYWQLDWNSSCPFCKEDWEKLIEHIKGLKAKVLLSASTDIISLPSNWERRLIHITNCSTMKDKHKCVEVQEWLFANYQLPREEVHLV